MSRCEGLSSTWAFATDFEQPSPKSEELAQPGALDYGQKLIRAFVICDLSCLYMILI